MESIELAGNSRPTQSENTIVPLLLDRMPLHASEGEIHLY